MAAVMARRHSTQSSIKSGHAFRSPPQPIVTSPHLANSKKTGSVSGAPNRKLSAGNGRYRLDPDEVFATHTVSEVKAILYKVRADADAKQEELRLMVGERYRDLLQASTSIIEIHELSKRVHQTVSEMERTTAMQDPDVSVLNEAVERNAEDSNLQSLQCLAAHVKILIDASEHLWRFLERKNFLHASWLFLVCRAVHRSLLQSDGEVVKMWSAQGINVQEQFPIVQRQWDAISHFRAQISHKATLSLREFTLSSQEVCESLLALHFLDSLPLMDAFELFLKQRTKTVSNSKRSPTAQSDSDTSSNQRQQYEVWDALQNLLESISSTLGSARDVLQDKSEATPSLLVQVLVYTQDGSSMQPLPLVPEDLRLTSSSLLSSLPSGSLFSVLPPDIKSYKPYIDLNSASSKVNQSVLSSRLQEWLTHSCEHVKNSSSVWLERLSSINFVWNVRVFALNWLEINPRLEMNDKVNISEVLNDVCRNRMEQIFRASLRSLLSNFQKDVTRAISSIADSESGSGFDLSPAKFLLIAPPPPSVTQVGLGAHRAEAALRRFKEAIKQRANSMTPHVDEIFTHLNTATSTLRADLDKVVGDVEFFSGLRKTYHSCTKESLDGMLTHLEDAIKKADTTVPQFVFCGRIADKIANWTISSTTLYPEEYWRGFASRCCSIYERSIDLWATKVSSGAAELFLSKSSDSGINASKMPWRPSPTMTNLLSTLVASVQSWGFFKDNGRRVQASCALLSKLAQIIHEKATSESHWSLATLWDLYLMRHVCGEWGEALASSSSCLEQVVHECTKIAATTLTLPLPSVVEFENSVSQSTDHMRLLLAPILPSSRSRIPMKSPKSQVFDAAQRRNSPSGAREVVGDHEMQPVVDVVKPTPRFGSLWVSEQ